MQYRILVLALALAPALLSPCARAATYVGRQVGQMVSLPVDDSSALFQPQLNGTCPGPSPFECPLSGACCPDRCCPSSYPFCWTFGCVDSLARFPCILNNVKAVCSLCLPQSIANRRLLGCDATSKFPSCPADSRLLRCLSDRGYLLCTFNGVIEEGMPCGSGCCPVRFTCTSTNTCLRIAPDETPSPFPIASTSPSLSPGATPVASATSPPTLTPTPEPSSSPPSSNDPSTTPPTDTTTTLPPDTTTGTTVADTTSTTTTDLTTTTTTTTTTDALGIDDSTTTPVPTNSNNNDGVCFPGTATVQRDDGTLISMQQLRTGDRVRVSTNEFSEVFMWTHRDPTYSGDRYVKLSTRGGQKLTATVGHMVPVCRGNSKGCVREIVQIEEIKVGDGVWVVQEDKGGITVVVRSERIMSNGLYNPQTMHGELVVDGVVSTCYTQYIPVRIAHSLLMPLRALYEAVDRVFGSKADFF